MTGGNSVGANFSAEDSQQSVETADDATKVTEASGADNAYGRNMVMGGSMRCGYAKSELS